MLTTATLAVQDGLALELTPGEYAALLVGLLSAFGWGLGCLLFDRLQTKRGGTSPLEERGIAPPTAAAMNLFKNTVACSVFVLVAVALGLAATAGLGSAPVWPAAGAAWLLFLSGIAGFAIGDAMYFASFPKAGVQLAAMIGNLTPPLAALLSWLFLDERIETAALLWMAVIVFGISLVVMDPVANPKEAGRAVAPRERLVGAGYALVSALAQAVGIVVTFKAAEGVDVLPATIWRLVGGIALAVPIALVLARGKGASARGALATLTRPLRSRPLFVLLLVPTFVATILCLPLHTFAVRGAPAHLSALVLATSPLFILPLGRFFHARHGWLSVVGTLIGFGGLAGVLLYSAPG